MIKKLFWNIFLVTLCLTSAQCTRNEIDDGGNDSDSDRELLYAYGYDTVGMVTCEKYYMLRPDLIVSKQRIQQMRKEPLTRMQSYNIYPSLLNDANQTVHIMDKNELYMKEALHMAIEEYNKIESNLRFVIDNKNENSVNMQSGNDGSGSGTRIMSIERPNHAGEYGRYVRINFAEHPEWVNDPYNGKNLMLHVLGHLAGFGHAITDDSDVNPRPGHISGTATVDYRSIMRTEENNECNLWSGLSDLDIKAIQKIYPYKEAAFDFDRVPSGDAILETDVQYTYKIKYSHPREPNPKFTVEIKGPTPPDYSLNVAGDTFYFTPHIAGQYFIIVHVTEVFKPLSLKKVVDVYSPFPFIVAPKRPTLGEPCEFGVKFSEHLTNPTYSVSISPDFSDYKYTLLSQTKNNFKVRFDSPGSYTLTVSRKDSKVAKNAKCLVTLYANPYYMIDDFSRPGRPYEFYLSFYNDAACKNPAYYTALSFFYNLYYRKKMNSEGEFETVEMEKPIETKQVVQTNSMSLIKLPTRGIDTMIKSGPIFPGSVRYKTETYAFPYYTITYPQNKCEVYNP